MKLVLTSWIAAILLITLTSDLGVAGTTSTVTLSPEPTVTMKTSWLLPSPTEHLLTSGSLDITPDVTELDMSSHAESIVGSGSIVSSWFTVTPPRFSTIPLSADVTDIITVALTTTDDVATLLPSSSNMAASVSAFPTTITTTTTSSTTTTTTPVSAEKMLCGGRLAPRGTHTDMMAMAPGVVQYRCQEGHMESGQGQHLAVCYAKTHRWSTSIPLRCLPVLEEEVVPKEGVARWIPVTVVCLAVILLMALGFLLAVTVYVCRGNHSVGVACLQGPQLPDPSLADNQKQRNEVVTVRDRKDVTRRWPWQQSAVRAASHVGPDGVALALGPDNHVTAVNIRS